MRNAIQVVLILPVLFVLSACIAIPVKTGDGADEPFSRKKLAFIEVGRSTKEDILTAFPRPMKFLDGDVWLYRAARQEDNWSAIVVFFGPNTVDGGLLPAETGETDYRFLVVSFDEYGVVRSVSTSGSEQRYGCNVSGVCGDGTVFSLVAPEELDRAAKSLEVPDTSCTAYVYGEPKTAVRIRIDGVEVGALFGKKGFIYQQPEQGTRHLSVTGHYEGGKGLIGHLDFDCEPGSTVYLHVRTENRRGFSKIREIDIVEQDGVQGRKAIGKRRLMLQADR